MLRSDKATSLSLLFKFILYVRLSNSLRESDVLLFSEFINIISVLFYNFIEFMILLYTFSVISFARYKGCVICLISFSKFSDVLPAFTCARAIVYFWSICLGVNISRLEWSEALATGDMWPKSEGSPLPFCCFLEFKIFSTVSTILFGFSILGICF